MLNFSIWTQSFLTLKAKFTASLTKLSEEKKTLYPNKYKSVDLFQTRIQTKPSSISSSTVQQMTMHLKYLLFVEILLSGKDQKSIKPSNQQSSYKILTSYWKIVIFQETKFKKLKLHKEDPWIFIIICQTKANQTCILAQHHFLTFLKCQLSIMMQKQYR